jgi:hypothetical protein
MMSKVKKAPGKKAARDRAKGLTKMVKRARKAARRAAKKLRKRIAHAPKAARAGG